ncbi:hypothetical protein NDU88_006565 [Pleurodeles waltl]|uniref:Uncharacterized protein n=1 Tax=Pleurodeles waltl TaxID=8319 RepID=A0AAV7WB16_PLEWA|nr:hypothetical protein NDU88_006565 [Pleurodeles waltl]
MKGVAIGKDIARTFENAKRQPFRNNVIRGSLRKSILINIFRKYTFAWITTIVSSCLELLKLNSTSAKIQPTPSAGEASTMVLPDASLAVNVRP